MTGPDPQGWCAVSCTCGWTTQVVGLEAANTALDVHWAETHDATELPDD